MRRHPTQPLTAERHKLQCSCNEAATQLTDRRCKKHSCPEAVMQLLLHFLEVASLGILGVEMRRYPTQPLTVETRKLQCSYNESATQLTNADALQPGTLDALCLAGVAENRNLDTKIMVLRPGPANLSTDLLVACTCLLWSDPQWPLTSQLL